MSHHFPRSPLRGTTPHLARLAALLLVLVLGCFPGLSVQAGAPLAPFVLDPALPTDVVVNPGQGLGQCHWVEVSVLSQPVASWGYDATETNSSWAVLEPRPGEFDWSPLDAQVHKASDLEKRIWLELLTTEGQTPSWARDAGVRLIGSRGGTPVPWDPAYQALLRRAVHAMAARYDDDPTVDAVNLMAGGCYGEMAICARETDTALWEQVGYTDDLFISAVKQIIDIYLEDEYTWPDGTTTHGFRHTPVVLQLGGGLYGHTAAVIQPVVAYAMETYGMRVWLKYNGLGGSFDMQWIFDKYSDVTRVGYEPAGTTPEFDQNPEQYVMAALKQHSSFLCLQKRYFALSDPGWSRARDLAARYLGSQILLQVEAPQRAAAGDKLVVNMQWVNRGTVPLMRPLRQGRADVPASYDIWLGLVDPASGTVVAASSFTPAPPTTRWYSAQKIALEGHLAIPSSLQSGTYELRVGLLNPDLPRDSPERYFRLVDGASSDEAGRYQAGSLQVTEAVPAVSATPAVTPVPPSPPVPQENALVRLVRALLDWLKHLFR
ncbi:MAG: hypothetical protein BWY10_00982 [Chloroflexi bacterium ADurb.Bin180]|nr:MAG: hypothetical protein BWY10_00982 [Chloroflexi bacterium ADurb.Bin180]